MAENGGKWSKMVEKSSPRLFGRKWIFACFTPWTPRQPGNQVENGRKWPKMGENGFPREKGGKWISACYPPFPYYLCLIFQLTLQYLSLYEVIISAFYHFAPYYLYKH